MENENIERLNKEVMASAEKLGLSLEEAKEKVADICNQNGLDASNNDDALIILNLWRHYFASVKMAQQNSDPENPTNSGGGSASWYKKALGMFIYLEDSRDMMALQHDRLKKEFWLDAETTVKSGKVALATLNDDETYTVVRYNKNERQERTVEALPESAMESEREENQWIIPLDSMAAYSSGPNANYGKPLPKEEFRRAGIFVGEVDGEFGRYFFNYKGEASKSFNPKTFEWVHFICIVNSSDASKIHGVKQTTLDSLMYNDALGEEHEDYRDMSQVNKKGLLMKYCEDNYAPIIDLERVHSMNGSKPYNERFVFTDGNVGTMSLSGDRGRLSISDLHSSFDPEANSYFGTTCWIPSHIDVDFGISSDIVVVGRTSQQTMDDGTLGACSINVFGIFVEKSRGKPVEAIEIVETEDWW
tara:strand:- start:6500 stop:7753 length:1254 start_codon:yes stop_codon:yes gene_type:complete